MDENTYNLGTRPAEGEAYSAGIAYITIPSDVDRDVYIANCYRTSTVSIYSEHNGFTARAIIGKIGIGFIEFPLLTGKFGSPVSFVIEPIHNQPMIIEVFSNQENITDLKEHQFKFKRQFEGNSVEITGSPIDKFIGINVSAKEGGAIFLNVESNTKDAKLGINVKGDIEAIASGNTSIIQHGSLELKTYHNEELGRFSSIQQTSDSNTLTSETTSINTNTLSINDGSEPFILGNKLAAFMKSMIEEIGNSTVTTMLGQMPLLNAAKILELQNKVDPFLSDTAFLDT